MNKILCIVGSTGTGKTKKAIELSKEQPSILVSADSRQVYRGMDIVTGKDHPKDITIYGIDIVNPNEPCSVAVWYDSVIPHIRQAGEDGKQVIVVGGTGLYIKALTGGIETMQVPINQSLRTELASLSISELQKKLSSISSVKYESMNHSDVLNPRRLTRAIEVTLSDQPPQKSAYPNLEIKMIGITTPKTEIYQNLVKARVVSRIAMGAIDETKSLVGKYTQNIQSMSAIGYKSIIKFLDQSFTESEMIDAWVTDELSYAKRQLTWFRKQKVIWYDVDNNS